MSRSFRVVQVDEAVNGGYPETQEYWRNDYRCCLYEFNGETPVRFVAMDGGEPEDQTFYRDWSWVPEELNKLLELIEILQNQGVKR